MDGLNEYQLKAAQFEGKHLLVLAGAGTGKTRTIVARAEYLINQGVSPHKIVILSFTRKSAAELAHRLKASISGNIDKKAITGRTFHSWCTEIMHRFAGSFPHHRFTPLDEDDRESAMGLAIGKNFKDSHNKTIKKREVVDVYSYALNTLCSLSEAIRQIRYSDFYGDKDELARLIEADRILIAPVIKKYIEFKQNRRYVDYDDILNVVATMLAKDEKLRKVVCARYQYILIDEMQDTNPLQYKLIQSFVEDSHLFCVGDDAQSIYGFRGADFEMIHSFTDRFPGSESQKLLLNYRSTQPILNLSNWLLEQSPLNYDKKLKAYRGDGLLPNLIHVENDWEEADIITDRILKSVSEEDDHYSDTLVLGRSNWALNRVEASCLAKKIPYIKLGGIGLMQSAHVRDVASAMRVVVNHFDELGWMRYLQLWDGIGEVTATKMITEIIEKENFKEVISFLSTFENKYMVNVIYETLERIHLFMDNPSEAMMVGVESMREILEKKYREEWKNRSSDFNLLKEVAKSTGSITEFITEYILDPKAETTLKIGLAPEEDTVILSTIHSAKGLEAKMVHVTNVNPRSYPILAAVVAGEKAVEEERRCLYVALTRAKDELNIYRWSKSVHTQQEDDTAMLREGAEYLSRLDENKVVQVSKVDNGQVSFTVFDKTNHQVEVLTTDKFQQSYKKKILYFLDNLPQELVNTVASESSFKRSKELDEDLEGFDFPDFDFS